VLKHRSAQLTVVAAQRTAPRPPDFDPAGTQLCCAGHNPRPRTMVRRAPQP